MPSVRLDPVAGIELPAWAPLSATKGEAGVRPRNTGAFAEPFPPTSRGSQYRRGRNLGGRSWRGSGLPPTPEREQGEGALYAPKGGHPLLPQNACPILCEKTVLPSVWLVHLQYLLLPSG